MAISTAPAVKSALVTVLSAAPELSGVTVTYGWPQAPTDQALVVGDIPTHDQEAATMGRATGSRVETYRIRVQIRVEHRGFDQQIATERAYEIAEVVAGALRADPTVTGTLGTSTQQGWAVLVAGPLEEGETSESRVALLTIEIECTAAI